MSAAERLDRVARTWNCRLRIPGRKSGIPREVTLWFVTDVATIYLTTLDPGRNWVRNLEAAEVVEVDIGGEAFQGRPTRVTDPEAAVAAHRRKYLPTRVAAWFGKRPAAVFALELSDPSE